MDWLKVKSALRGAVLKYKYPLLVVCIGVLFLLIPFGKNPAKRQVEEVIIPDSRSILNDEERLSAILSAVAGAGNVKVFLTTSRGEETVYQTDQQNAAGNGNFRAETVTITDAQRNEQGLVKQVNPPAYKGAIIVCDGADNPAVCLAIVNAVSNATGLGADKITVLKMK